MFEEVAAFWWESVLVTNFAGKEFNTITWLEFLAVFNVRYYLEQLRDQRAREFSNLKQGDIAFVIMTEIYSNGEVCTECVFYRKNSNEQVYLGVEVYSQR